MKTKEQRDWENTLNDGLDEGFYDFTDYPVWQFDLGNNLWYEGGVIFVEGKFRQVYDKWEGEIIIGPKGETLVSKNLECDSIDHLKAEAKKFVDEIREKIKTCLDDKD